MPAERKFQILVRNEAFPENIRSTNDRLRSLQVQQGNEAARGIFGDLLKTAFGSSFVQKSVNASSNVLGLGISYLTEALRSPREKWHRAAEQQCRFQRKLSTNSIINDFYAAPSVKGALDPENMAFQGFGCRNFIELTNQPGNGTEVFYLFCTIDRGEEGLQRIVNHSKFVVKVDSFRFSPKYCGLPCDSTGRYSPTFDFKKRKDLTLNLTVRIYSSWINEAIMVTQDQQLGEFHIQARIREDMLNADSVFVYDKNNPAHQELVSVEGDCFIVPRSYTGTTNATDHQRAWGTGQYRIEMDVAEQCSIRDEYYQVPQPGNGAEVAFADGTPGKRKWDKKKWQAEWTEMKQRQSGKSVLGNLWSAVYTAYKGTSWVTTLTDPFATALYQYETQKLNDWLDLAQSPAGGQQGAGKQTAKPATGTGDLPQKPAGGNMPK